MSFLSHIHSEVRRALATKRGATNRPEDVPTGVHKEYTRMPQVALPEPEQLTTTLANALNERSSQRSSDLGAALTLAELGTLFGLSLRAHAGTRRRRYPSGGALYPVETYFISEQLEGHRPSVFHYNPTRHTLEKLWDLPGDVTVKELVPHPADHLFPSLIVFTSVWQRSSAKYGDLSYSHALLEGGHMSENVLLVATALRLICRPMAGFRDELLSKLLDLDEEVEQPIHTITLSKNRV